MHSTPILALLLALVSSYTAPVQAGFWGDIVDVTLKTTLTGGIYLPYKMRGLRRRCKNDAFQSQDACVAQLGCTWVQSEPADTAELNGRRKKPVDGEGQCVSAGFSVYMRDVDLLCGLKTEKKQCHAMDGCSWTRFGKKCQARWLHAFRHTSTDRELTEDQVEEIVRRRQQLEMQKQKQETSKVSKENKGSSGASQEFHDLVEEEKEETRTEDSNLVVPSVEQEQQRLPGTQPIQSIQSHPIDFSEEELEEMEEEEFQAQPEFSAPELEVQPKAWKNSVHPAAQKIRAYPPSMFDDDGFELDLDLQME